MRDELRPLLARAQEKHPSMSVGVSIVGCSEDKFSRISSLSLGCARSRRNLFKDISEETAGGDSDSNTSVFSGGGSEDESMSEGENDATMDEDQLSRVKQYLLLRQAIEV
ncbi:hypothetical protein PHYPSEUDO_014393 [Phytophthora pseudosyringae]|uniref:Uncharacterized protein n=1 Tax=Phytophthora pseudosyringae TaxID=221518 RepID=A0A8T1W6A8_9STRA|nr:hypothetical protein PHYPSEUDO_014393 [Phytophthora pseudosyringae]